MCPEKEITSTLCYLTGTKQKIQNPRKQYRSIIKVSFVGPSTDLCFGMINWLWRSQCISGRTWIKSIRDIQPQIWLVQTAWKNVRVVSYREDSGTYLCLRHSCQRSIVAPQLKLYLSGIYTRKLILLWLLEQWERRMTPLRSSEVASGTHHMFWQQLLHLSWIWNTENFPLSKTQYSSLFPGTSSDEIPFILLKYLVRPLTGDLKDTCACYIKIIAYDLEKGTTLNKI